MPSPAELLTLEIDTLLEQYLQNLHTYTTLRSQLSSLQTSVFQNISRANFHPIGVSRYGASSYSAHMRAETLCSIPSDASSIQVHPAPLPVPASPATTGSEEKQKQKENENENENIPANPAEKKASLRMFGAFVPAELKVAQGQAVLLVQDIVPRIVHVDREMRELEIRIRRARKYRAREEGKSGRVREVEVEAH